MQLYTTDMTFDKVERNWIWMPLDHIFWAARPKDISHETHNKKIAQLEHTNNGTFIRQPRMSGKQISLDSLSEGILWLGRLIDLNAQAVNKNYQFFTTCGSWYPMDHFFIGELSPGKKTTGKKLVHVEGHASMNKNGYAVSIIYDGKNEEYPSYSEALERMAQIVNF